MERISSICCSETIKPNEEKEFEFLISWYFPNRPKGWILYVLQLVDRNVKKGYNDICNIAKGSFVAILGHNGSGKSTFAKQINGILTPTDGTVWVSGMNTADEDAIWEIRKKAGMVFQNPDNQIIGNVVEEDVGFGPENIGVPTDDIWKRVDASLEAVGMTAYRYKSPNK